MALDSQFWIHYQGVLIKKPKICAMRVFGQGMSNRWNSRPRTRRSIEIIVGDIGEECCISCTQSVSPKRPPKVLTAHLLTMLSGVLNPVLLDVA